ncbi:unnamed protein product [Rhodiola kirilowii]
MMNDGGEKRFALLLAARDSEYAKKVYGGYFNVFVAAFGGGGGGERWDLYRVVDGEFPDMDDDELIHLYDGFVISGSPFDAYGDDDWILRLCRLIQVLDAMQKKVLGICFGHQVICRALGGKVGKSSTGWDLGLRQVKTANDASARLVQLGLPEIPSSLSIIECHQDEVLKVPAGAHIVASSDKTGVEMFVVGNHMMGIQGHPEYTKDILFNLVDRLLGDGSIRKEMAEEAKLKMERGEPDREQWLKMCKKFLTAQRGVQRPAQYPDRRMKLATQQSFLVVGV